MEEVPSVWIYPHVPGPEFGFELGIEEFRSCLEDEAAYGETWNHNYDNAREGDTIVFAFKEGEEWIVTGDGLVRKKVKPAANFKVAYIFECVRLYPRNVPYKSLNNTCPRLDPRARW